MNVPRVFPPCACEKRGTKWPWFTGSMSGSWELTERARRSALVASQPWGRGQFGGGSGSGYWGNLFGQDPKEMVGQGGHQGSLSQAVMVGN